MPDESLPPNSSAVITARRLIRPVATAVVIALAGIVALVWVASRGQDEIATRSSVTLVSSIFREIERDIGRLAFDYSFWDAATENLIVRTDPDWADNNVGSYVADTFDVTETFVVSADDETLIAFASGEQVAVDAFAYLGAPLRRLIDRARAAPMDQPEPATGFVMSHDVLHVVGVSAFSPEYPTAEDLVRHDRPVLIYARHIDAEVLERLAGDLLLPGLAVTFAPPAADDRRASLALANPDGTDVAWLVWMPATPGSDLFRDILPLLAAGMVVLLALMIVFFRRVQSAAARMEAGARDLADRERQLAQTSKLAVLGEMAAGIVHELNQPLNIIRMTSDSMQQYYARPGPRPDDDEVREQFSIVSQQAMRMSEIIQNMRLFSRDDFGRRAAFDPVESVEHALSWFRTEAAAHDIELIVEAPPACGRVYGESARFEQVVLNLVGNARDAIVAAAADTGEDRPGPAGTIRVSIVDSVADGRVRIIVRDTGGGIPPGVLDRVFEPFFTTKGQGEGTGLGLSISYGIVAGMDGSIVARNVDGGAEFAVDLPRLAPPGASGGIDEAAQ